MAAYIWATVNMGDPAGFAAYAKAGAVVAARFGGEYVLRGQIEDVYEGACEPASRAVVIRFPNAGAAQAYMASADYRATKELRVDAGGAVHSRLVVTAD